MAPGLDPSGARDRVMMDSGADDLRKAAAHARQFAWHLPSPELKESFFKLASKWEAEARAMEADNDARQR